MTSLGAASETETPASSAKALCNGQRAKAARRHIVEVLKVDDHLAKAGLPRLLDRVAQADAKCLPAGFVNPAMDSDDDRAFPMFKGIVHPSPLRSTRTRLNGCYLQNRLEGKSGPRCEARQEGLNIMAEVLHSITAFHHHQDRKLQRLNAAGDFRIILLP